MKGICKICGCTENNPCTHPEFGPCWWLDEDKQDLCGHCVELKGDPGVTRPPIRALSLRQPFASLMLPPFNKIETRTWPTKYRGPVLICASQKAYPWNVVRDICGPEQFDRLLSSKMQYNEKRISHWAEELQIGDRCKATIRHKTDGSKNLHNVEIIVVENLQSEKKIVGYYNKRKKQIPYNELTRLQTDPDGHAIALGILVDCRPMQPADEEKCFVQYYSDLWCHVYENVRPIKPFPWKGSQGWKVLTEEQTRKIELI